MHTFTSLLLAASASGLAAASPKPLAMPFHRRTIVPEALAERASEPESVTLTNAVQHFLYYVNASIGSPGQTVELQLDTGSSDVWMFSPDACDEVQCNGGSFDPSKSSSYKQDNSLPAFQIQYVTPGSLVKGTYFTDDFSIGDIKISNNIMALAEKARQTFQGIMGVGYPADESIFAETRGRTGYNNTIVALKNQGIIPSNSYSLYLDDIFSASGTILFGGYDTKKYSGSLTVLNILRGPSGIRNEMAVDFSYLGLTDSKGTTLVGGDVFPLYSVLDTGTTLTRIPSGPFEPIANYFGAYYDRKYGTYIVSCDIAKWKGTLDFGFGGGASTIQVPFAELAIPLNQLASEPTADGSKACQFGLDLSPAGTPVLLGDTFLRSAYVIYDLEAYQIAIGQTVFDTSSSSIKPIPAGGDLKAILGSGVKAATSVSAIPTHSGSNATMQIRTSPGTMTRSISGVTTSLPLSTTVAAETTRPLASGAASTSSKGAAAAPTQAVVGAKQALTGGSLLAALMVGLF